MTTKWQYNPIKIHATGRNQTKLPDFYHQNQQKTPHNNLAKRSLNNGHLAPKSSKIKGFGVFLFFCDVNMMLRNKGCYFSYSKWQTIEIPIRLWYNSIMEKYPWQGGNLPTFWNRFAGIHREGGDARDSLWNYYGFPGNIGSADFLWWLDHCSADLSR